MERATSATPIAIAIVGRVITTYMGSNTEMNQCTKPIQKMKKKGLRATTFPIAKLEE